MSILTTNNLSKFFGADEIFSDITVSIPNKARIALVGPNGAGKTTLLNLLTGRDLPTEGTMTLAKGTRIGFLPQRPELEGEHTLWEEALAAVEHLLEMEGELSRLEHEMSDPELHDAVLASYGPLQESFEIQGGYTYDNRIRMVLQGVGFSPDDYQMPLTKLSGGQVTRAFLARLLLDEPDLLILDEPTNHLDINAIEWLESFLGDFPGAVVAVSHDRYFMDRFASIVWEMEFGLVEVYRGNYSHYMQQCSERHERLWKEYESQQEFVAKEEDYIRKHMGSRWTAQAKGRLKKLKTMEKRGKIIRKPRERNNHMNLRIQAAMRSGDKVLMTKNVSVGYPDGDGPLFHVPDITLFRGETAALVGPNGVGKTTFIKTAIRELAPLSGEVKIGASVKVGYFAQAHERLNPENTLVDELSLIKPMPISAARNYLAKFLFRGDDVFRPVATLSGGERGRLALAKLSLQGANLLFLDEPTNHLDIESQEILQDVLSAFEGTILLVSHDRYLIDALATQIWAANPGDLTIFNGSYNSFVAERNKRAEALTAREPDRNNSKTESNIDRKSEKIPNKQHGLNDYQLRKRLTKVEEQISKLEEKLGMLQENIEKASAIGNIQAVSDLGAEYTQLEEKLETIIYEWEILSE
jgi:ATP-binding cassette, subfamily F, member 3